jgi:ComF family protein
MTDGELLCPDCEDGLKTMRLTPAERGDGSIQSVYRYDGVAKMLVRLLKEDCTADAALVLADGISAAVRDMHLPPDTLITWVSMPELRRRKRGIDHGRTLCEAVAVQTGLEVRQLLVRTRHVHTQRGLNRDKRLTNLEGRFTAKVEPGRPVLLVDDVLTTGATADVCVRALRQAGSGPVYVLTATRVTR